MFRPANIFLSFLLICWFPASISAKSYTPPSAHSSEEELWGKKHTPEKPKEIRKETLPIQTTDSFQDKAPEPTPLLPTWLKYAVPVPDTPEDAPMIAIVIDDLGLNKAMTRAVLSLPPPITASFLSYADDLPQQTEQARLNGHELLLHTPMEPINPRFNPGPGALRSDMSAEEIAEKFKMMLTSFDGYVGINNHMGSKFTSDKQSISVVIDELRKRELLFLDSLTSGNSAAWKSARDQHVPYAVRDIFLDNSQNEEEIMKQLLLVEKHALQRRTSVAIGHPHPTTINALKKWIPKAQKKGFVFVPISTIALIKQDAF
ncbi:MAG: divergent polysaccharide deacetylase family protein [Alphaproteobacteria bacterium]|nr:divergent polysaccharide deacetylase family protein [Alphaproteobacteria bacterium]